MAKWVMKKGKIKPWKKYSGKVKSTPSPKLKIRRRKMKV